MASQYGVPYNFGLVGFWYNKDLFAQAGITEPPATWEEFLADVQKLKDAGITPIALAGGDKWPAMFYWAYLALRAGGQEALDAAIASGDWTGPAFVEAGDAAQAADRPGALPGRLPRRGLQPRPGVHHGQRQGRHGADGPVGPGRPDGGERVRHRHR